MANSEKRPPEEKWLKLGASGVEVDVLAVPRASRSRIIGVHGDRLKIQLAAPPAHGEANDALVQLLAKALRVKKSAVTLLAGHGSRRKRVLIEGADADVVRGLLEG